MDNFVKMSSSKSYMIRALNEWILDNGLTPYIVINCFADNVSVPEEYVVEGKITLNISPNVVQALHITNEHVHFSARFSGIPKHIVAPISAVMAIYARENGRGMVFTEDEEDSAPPVPPKPVRKKPVLTVVK